MGDEQIYRTTVGRVTSPRAESSTDPGQRMSTRGPFRRREETGIKGQRFPYTHHVSTRLRVLVCTTRHPESRW